MSLREWLVFVCGDKVCGCVRLREWLVFVCDTDVCGYDARERGENTRCVADCLPCHRSVGTSLPSVKAPTLGKEYLCQVSSF